MKNEKKTKEQLIDEVEALHHQRIVELEAMEAKYRQAEASLRDSKERFSRLSEAAFEGICRVFQPASLPSS